MINVEYINKRSYPTFINHPTRLITPDSSAFIYLLNLFAKKKKKEKIICKILKGLKTLKYIHFYYIDLSVLLKLLGTCN